MKEKIKSEKGYTGVDIAISIIVLFIFVSIIATLSYRFNSLAKEMELKSTATSLAIDEIENIKNKDFNDLKEEKEDSKEIDGKQGFYRTVIIEDYADIKQDKERELVKKITVKIEYIFKDTKEPKKIELSTIMTKES